MTAADVYWAPSEAQFQRHIILLCRTFRLAYYHTHDSRRSVPGFPDLVVVGPGGLIFAELKTETGRLSKAQKQWISILEAAGQEVHVWRPGDRRSIEARLEQLTHRRTQA